MASLEDLRKKLVLQQESLEPVKKKERANAGKKQVLSDEIREAKRIMASDPERIAKMQEGRRVAAEKRRAEKEEIQRLLKQEAMEKLKGKIEKETLKEIIGKPSKATKERAVEQKIEQLTEKIENTKNTELIEKLNSQIAQLTEKMETMAKPEPVPAPVPATAAPAVKEPEPEPEPEKIYRYRPKPKTSLRKTYYDPYGLGY
jgi:myosin heavy subunit